MNNDFDLDEILSEVKKHKEFEEHKTDEKTQKDLKENDEKIEENTVEENEIQTEVSNNIKQIIKDKKEEKIESNKKDLETENSKEEESKSQDEKEVETKEVTEEKLDKEEAEENSVSENKSEVVVDSLDGDKKKKKKMSKAKKIVISVVVILLVLIIAFLGFGYFYVNHMLDEVTEEEKPQAVEQWNGMDTLDENFSDVMQEAPASEISSLSDMVKTWYYTGTPVHSSHVLNILLIGEDTRGEDIKEEGTRADSAIIASINKDTQKITLTSILRDTYVYYEVEEGNKESGVYDKINSAMSIGGLDCYIRAVENNFKLNIDNYVIVNFDSFKTIIDTLGGVDINMKAKEVREIIKHPEVYGDIEIKKTFEGDEGVMTLNGEQALAYSRIRHIDSDNERANRQKNVLMALFEKAKAATPTQILEMGTKLIPYVKTGVGKKEILNMGQYALKNNWISFDVQTVNTPENFEDEEGNIVKTAIGGKYKGKSKSKNWKWRADLPLSAQRVQLLIYGKTNIVLNENRPNFKNLT